jgi:hypothetical protein
MVMDKAIAIAKDRQAVPDRLDEPGADGDAARRELLSVSGEHHGQARRVSGWV